MDGDKKNGGTPQGQEAPKGQTEDRDRPAGRTIKFESDSDGRDYEFEWPASHHISRYTQEAMGGNGLKAATNLAVTLAIRPTAAELTRLFEDKPGLPIALAGAIAKSSGIAEEFSVKH